MTELGVTISLSMIVKNEGRWIENCLESVKNLVDEIIVVDTGSTDDTILKAKSFNAKVFNLEWPNSFSLARNFSLKQASSDWILVLDADEVISQEDILKIRECIKNTTVDMYSLNQLNYTQDSSVIGWIPNHLQQPEAKGYLGYMLSPLTRLFRNNGEIYFDGIIHEHANDHRSNPQKPVETKINIHHYGKYKPDEVKTKKAELYLELSLKKCEEHPENSHFWYELGVQYQEIGNKTKAQECYMKAVELDSDYFKPQLLLAVLESDEGNYLKALKRFSSLLEKYPRELSLYIHILPLLIDMKNYPLAEKIAELGCRIMPDQPTLFINRGVVYQSMGNHRTALECFDAAIKINPEEPLAHYNKGVSLQEIGHYEKANDCYVKAYDYPSTKILTLKKFGELSFVKNDYESALKYMNEYIELKSDDDEIYYQIAIVLIKKGNLSEAKNKLNQIKNYKQFNRKAIEDLIQCYLAVGDERQAEKLKNKLLLYTKEEGDTHHGHF